jgi:hypothetical protein
MQYSKHNETIKDNGRKAALSILMGGLIIGAVVSVLFYFSMSIMLSALLWLKIYHPKNAYHFNE